jgi:hypothetical protein
MTTTTSESHPIRNLLLLVLGGITVFRLGKLVKEVNEESKLLDMNEFYRQRGEIARTQKTTSERFITKLQAQRYPNSRDRLRAMGML